MYRTNSRGELHGFSHAWLREHSLATAKYWAGMAHAAHAAVVVYIRPLKIQEVVFECHRVTNTLLFSAILQQRPAVMSGAPCS